MIINKRNILHIQEPYHNDELIWIDIYMVSGILRLGFTYNKLIEKLAVGKAEAFYQSLEQEMRSTYSHVTVSNQYFNFIKFINLYQVEDFNQILY